MNDANEFIEDLASTEEKANAIIEEAKAEAKKRKELLSNNLSAREEDWKSKIDNKKEDLLEDYNKHISKELKSIKSEWESKVKHIEKMKVKENVLKEMANLLVE